MTVEFVERVLAVDNILLTVLTPDELETLGQALRLVSGLGATKDPPPTKLAPEKRNWNNLTGLGCCSSSLNSQYLRRKSHRSM